MITEFKRYQITPEMLQLQMKELGESAHLDPGEKSLTSKLDDLSYVYEKLVIALHDKYVDAEDQLQLLADKISETTLLEDAEIYFDGCHRFTPQELHVSHVLRKKCKRGTVALNMNKTHEDDVTDMDVIYTA